MGRRIVQQPVGVQALEPLRIADVGLSSRNVFGVAGIDQEHLESTLFKDLVDGDPIDAGRFHGDALHAALGEPLGGPI